MNAKARDDSGSPVCSQDQAQHSTQLQTDSAVAGMQSSSPAAAAHLSPHVADAVGFADADIAGQSLDVSVPIEETF